MADASRPAGCEVLRYLASVGPFFVETKEAGLMTEGRREGAMEDNVRVWRGRAERRSKFERIDI